MFLFHIKAIVKVISGHSMINTTHTRSLHEGNVFNRTCLSVSTSVCSERAPMWPLLMIPLVSHKSHRTPSHLPDLFKCVFLGPLLDVFKFVNLGTHLLVRTSIRKRMVRLRLNCRLTLKLLLPKALLRTLG